MKPTQMFDHPHSKYISPNVQCSFVPFPQYEGAQGPVPPPPLSLLRKLQRAVSSPLSLLFLQIRQNKCPQTLLIGHAFQLCYKLCSSPLDAFKYLNIIFVLWSLELHAIFLDHFHLVLPCRAKMVFDHFYSFYCSLGCSHTLMRLSFKLPCLLGPFVLQGIIPTSYHTFNLPEIYLIDCFPLCSSSSGYWVDKICMP